MSTNEDYTGHPYCLEVLPSDNRGAMPRSERSKEFREDNLNRFKTDDVDGEDEKKRKSNVNSFIAGGHNQP